MKRHSGGNRVRKWWRLRPAAVPGRTARCPAMRSRAVSPRACDAVSCRVAVSLCACDAVSRRAAVSCPAMRFGLAGAPVRCACRRYGRIATRTAGGGAGRLRPTHPYRRAYPSRARLWWLASASPRRLVVNPVRAGRQQRQRRCRVPEPELVRAASLGVARVLWLGGSGRIARAPRPGGPSRSRRVAWWPRGPSCADRPGRAQAAIHSAGAPPDPAKRHRHRETGGHASAPVGFIHELYRAGA